MIHHKTAVRATAAGSDPRWLSWCTGCRWTSNEESRSDYTSQTEARMVGLQHQIDMQAEQIEQLTPVNTGDHVRIKHVTSPDGEVIGVDEKGRLVIRCDAGASFAIWTAARGDVELLS